MATTIRRPGAAAPEAPPTDRRTAIIRGAAAVVGRDGYSATSIKEIAAEAGVAPGLVHYYFASKDELIVAVASTLCDEVREHWLRAGEGVDDPIERLDAAVRYIDDLRRDHPEFYRLIFDLYVAGFANDAIRSRMRQLWDDYVAIIEVEVARMFTAFDIPAPGGAHDLASGIAAALDGIALMALANGHDPAGDYQALKTMLLSVVVTAHLAAGREPPLDRLAPLLVSAGTTGSR